MPESDHTQLSRTMGLSGATGIGVGAIVGGGILALAGSAFIAAGPSAILAFAANGAIAVLTALSYAEMGSAFPESGGTYAFSKKVLSAPAAFMVGWVVWFASVVASVLYALGFAAFASAGLERLLQLIHVHAVFSLTARPSVLLLAGAATVGYSLSLIRKSTSGGQWATWGKVIVFLVIIGGGLLVFLRRPAYELSGRLSPFFPHGMTGVIKAMGYTFIALQGFDLIAAMAGEVKDPRRNIPGGMLFSLGIALVIYLPLLLVVATVGVPSGQNIAAMSLERPDTVVAVAVRNYLGPFGYWLVVVAAVLAMLSALRANLMAASRVALSMAADRALPRIIGRISEARHTPVHAIVMTLMMVLAILLVIPDIAAAGAAASLIFLVSFALTHWTAILARMRVGAGALPFKAPWFPAVQIVGGLTCLGLAVFQGLQVPSAGLVGALWLGAGLALYLVFFARRARIVDASNAAVDPQLMLLRGRSPLVLVPIANPANAAFMVTLATAMAPPSIGRVLLLSVVSPPQDWKQGRPLPQLDNSQHVLRDALNASFVAGLKPEALITVAPHAWLEIIRVARNYRCESLLIGLSDLEQKAALQNLERLMSQVDSDVVVLRANSVGNLSKIKRVLVPVGGRGQQDLLRARLLGSMRHLGIEEITFLLVLREDAQEEALPRAQNWLRQLAEDERAAGARIVVKRSKRPAEEIIRLAAEVDLLILGLQRQGRRRKIFGEMVLQIAHNTTCGLVLINSKG
ncbi:MAG: amino acid permease [Desulfobacteraceae bacterium]|nr:amino acid permease [Desulfobacteraceae bacterium]